MPALLASLVTWFLTVAIRKLFLGAGIAFATGAIYLTVMNYLISRLNSYGSGLGDIGNLIKISGIDVGISLVIGAYIVRKTIDASKLALVKS